MLFHDLVIDCDQIINRTTLKYEVSRNTSRKNCTLLRGLAVSEADCYSTMTGSIPQADKVCTRVIATTVQCKNIGLPMILLIAEW